MLEKNKDYLEMRVFNTDCAFTQNAATQISVDGYVYTTYMNIPDPGELYVLISKEKFESLQADNQHYRELAKQWEDDYYLLLKKTGFDTVEELVNYLDSEAQCDTLCDAWKATNRKLEECEKDYIFERDRAEALKIENEKLKNKLNEYDPFPDFKELFKKLYSIEDTEALEWALNHTVGGQGSVNGWRASSQFWNGRYKDLVKLVGFSSKKEVEDYLVNEAECDTLYEAISKLKDQVKYTCDEWYSANSSNNSWKAAAECNSPKELIEKREALEKEIEVYSRALQEWKEGTGCPSPSAAKTLIESGASWHHAYRDVKASNEKLTDDVKSWKNVTGYSTPEDYMHARLNNKTLLYCTDVWQDATGCNSPEQAKERIKALNERINELEADYNYLLCTTGFESEGEIEDALDQCDHSTLRKALVDYEFDYEELLKLTGYKSNQDIRVALNYSEQFVYETLRELINSLKRNAKFTETNWQKATGCDTPGRAEEKLEYYKERLGKAIQAASCAAKHLENITF